MTGSSHISKIDEYHYVGLDRITPTGLTSDNVDIKWNIDNLLLIDTDEKIKGKWKFAFSLQATDSQVQLTNQSCRTKWRNGQYRKSNIHANVLYCSLQPNGNRASEKQMA